MSRFPEVRFPGFKHSTELAQYMAAADVFVYPSLTDTFGMVMLEANACGVPIAAFPIIGPKQVVQNGVNGIIDEDLASAVHQAIRVEPLSCRQEAKKYSWEACTGQFLRNLHDNSTSRMAEHSTISALSR
jgi:glycosyltransferase involved in cell wall biosynthesis